jgi:hypothetical protein
VSLKKESFVNTEFVIGVNNNIFLKDGVGEGVKGRKK